jgi:CRISPR-associated endonuclease/helicase Cas3
LLALQVPQFRAWLTSKFSEEELIRAVWVAIGHHLKAGINSQGKESDKITELPDGAGFEVMFIRIIQIFSPY